LPSGSQASIVRSTRGSSRTTTRLPARPIYDIESA
jgi:hypothetical protein